MPLPIQTPHLELIPANQDILTSDLDHDYEKLGLLLNAVVPGAWPPTYIDDPTLAEFIRMLEDGSDPYFCSWYWVLASREEQNRTLIGSGGAGSSSKAPGSAMIGYSVLDTFQNKGYATEAIRNLIPAIFRYPGIQRIIATTYPELKALSPGSREEWLCPGGHGGWWRGNGRRNHSVHA
jgi:hypothetical protein